MTLKAICDCSTCDACGNAPGRSGSCLNCEVTDSGAPGTHAQPEKNPNDHDRPHRFDVPGGMVGECLFWGCTERNPEEKITPAMHRAAPALLEALRAAHSALRTFSPNVPEAEQGWTSFDSDTLEAIEAALAAAEGK